VEAAVKADKKSSDSSDERSTAGMQNQESALNEIGVGMECSEKSQNGNGRSSHQRRKSRSQRRSTGSLGSSADFSPRSWFGEGTRWEVTEGAGVSSHGRPGTGEHMPCIFFDVNPATARALIKSVMTKKLSGCGKIKLVDQKQGYLRFEVRNGTLSRVYDDVEFIVNAKNKYIDFRAQARGSGGGMRNRKLMSMMIEAFKEMIGQNVE